jgi:hypothetical protein
MSPQGGQQAKHPTQTLGQKKAARPRNILTSEIMADIALARFSGLKEFGRLIPMKQLAHKFGHDRAVISKAITKACKQGLIVIRKVGKPTEPSVDKNLEGELLDKYPKLQAAVVIKSVPSLSDDLVHRHLGSAMAKFIVTNPVLQTGDVVGVGSGRGVERTIQALEYYGKLRAQHLTLMSLTGSVYSTPKSTIKGLWLDADRHVIEFAKHFDLDNEPTQYLISHPLAYATYSELKRARQRVWLGAPTKGKNGVPKLTHVFIGVGTFASGPHRFYVEASSPPNEQEPFLKPIHNELVRLKQLCEDALSSFSKRKCPPDYSAAAEMSNLFFYVPPPKNLAIKNEKAILECIQRINSRCLNVKEEQILGTQMLVVAGTTRKAHALRALLDRYPVTYLCTDADAAKAIVSGEA